MSSRSDVFSNLGTKFEEWLKEQGPNKVFAASGHYRENLKAIGDPVASHTSSTGKWHGLYELLTGDRPSKGVFDVSSVGEFSAQYGKAALFFSVEKKAEQVKEQLRPHYPNCQNFDELYDFAYTSEHGDGGHTRRGYVKYCQFLCELEASVDEETLKECEVKKMKAADYSTSQHQPSVKKAKVNLSKKEDVVLLRLCAALRAKPFAILAGHSGTGKSRMVRQLAYMTAAAHNHRALFEENGQRLTVPGNFCMVQVKPNWHDSTDLLGFYSEMKGAFKGTDFVKFICRAYAYPDVPFFVCLDEMNLAPVEHYFAEYLSAIESRKLVKDVETMDKGGNVVKTETVMTDRLLPDEAWRNSVGAPDYSSLGCEYNQSQCWLEKHGLTIPRNLFVVGTVNMDESTNQFTRKVLDRAFTLEMTDADFEHFGESDPEPTFDDFAGDDFADALLSGTMIAKKPEPTAAQDEQARFKKQIDNLTALKPVLDGTSFVVAYRFANEYMLYESAFAEMRKVMDVSSHDPAQQGTASANPAYEPEAFDDMILMKLLPRISGDQAVVMRIFVGESDPNKDSKKLDDADVGGLAKLLKQKGASFEKMQEIVRRGEANGGETLTFWP